VRHPNVSEHRTFPGERNADMESASATYHINHSLVK